MAVITISRQCGSGGDEIASQLCRSLGYRRFDDKLMAQLVHQAGLAPNEVADFSEDGYPVRGFLDRLRGRERV